MGIASVFVGITVLMVVVGLAVNPFFLFVAVPFGGTAYLMWYQASGKLAERPVDRPPTASSTLRAASDGLRADSEPEQWGWLLRPRTHPAREKLNRTVDGQNRTVDRPNAATKQRNSHKPKRGASSASRPRQANPK